MNIRTVLSYGSLLVTVFFAACHKDSTPPASPPTLGTMNVNLTFSFYNDTSKSNFELIISEPGGKVLLDSVAPVNTPVKAALKTNATLVDVTTIFYLSFDSTYEVYAFKSVNPSDWVSARPGSYTIPISPYPSSTVGQTIVRNFPATAIYGTTVYNSFIFTCGPYNFDNFATFFGTTLTLGYQRFAGFYNYFAAPALGPGLYKLYHPAGDKDTIDCNHLDTLVSINFPRPAPFTVNLQNSGFRAIPDTTDFDKSIDLLAPFIPRTFPHADLLYPKEHMQKYELWLSATNSLNDYVSYYSYSNTVPTAPVFPDPASFAVASTQNDNFSVSFTGNKPTYCQTAWNNGKVYLHLYSSPDSTTIHPLTLLTNQKSKLLNGLSLSNLALHGFEFENITGLNYSTYFSYICDPSLLQTRRITTSSTYSRNY